MLHINILELWVVHYACHQFLPKIKGHSIRIVTDNRAVMYYINSQEGAKSPSLCIETIKLWNLCLTHQIDISVAFLPAMQNTMADVLIGYFHQDHEWELKSFGRSASAPQNFHDTIQNEMPSFLLEGQAARCLPSNASVFQSPKPAENRKRQWLSL